MSTGMSPSTPLPPQTPTSLVPPVLFEDGDADEVDANGEASGAGQATVDLRRFVDPTPLSVAPRLPLATALELFQKMGPRVILVERRGTLLGLVTVKDCLRFQAAADAAQHGGGSGAAGGGSGSGGESADRRAEQRAWALMRRSADLLAGVLRRWTGGRVRLGEDLAPGPSRDPRDTRGTGAENLEGEALVGDGRISEGTEDEGGMGYGEEVELDER